MNCRDANILIEVLKEHEKALKKYDWKNDYNLNIFEMVALVMNECGEALQAANKTNYNQIDLKNQIRQELIQVISTALRVIKEIDNDKLSKII